MTPISHYGKHPDCDSSGIYAITNRETGKRYIGSAVKFKVRWANHLSELSRNGHHSVHLQRSFNKHGANAFLVDVLEVVQDKCDLVRREQFWIDQERPEYNIAPNASSSIGITRRPETLSKMSQVRKGKKLPPRGPHTEETKAKISASKKGKSSGPCPEETKRKISLSQKGKIITAETRAKLSAALMGRSFPKPNLKGRKLSEQHRAAISDSNKGRVVSDQTKEKTRATMVLRCKDPEYRKNLSDKHKGKTLSQETKEKIRQARLTQACPRTGKKHSEETKRKLSDLAKGRPAHNKGLHKTHCKRGHAFAPENTYEYNGRWHCKSCARDSLRRRRQKNKLASLTERLKKSGALYFGSSEAAIAW